MYDLKNFDPISQDTNKDSNRDISDRGYFNNRMTSSVLTTKCAYIPSDDLF